jgi:hypothetical protein
LRCCALRGVRIPEGELSSRCQALAHPLAWLASTSESLTDPSRKRIGLLPPLSPFRTSRDLRVFDHRCSHPIASCGGTLWSFCPTSASCPSAGCLSTGVPCRLDPHLEKHLAEAACPFSICGYDHPSKALLAKCEKSLPGSFQVPPPGFGYPLDGVSRSYPWKLFPAPNTLGIPSSELSSSPVTPESFPTLAPFLHLVTKPLSLAHCASMASAHRKSSVSHSLPKGLVRGETLCSPEVSGLPDPLPSKPIEKASPFPNSPRVLKNCRLSTATPGTSGSPVL